MNEQEKTTPLSPVPVNPLRFKLPEVEDVEIFVLRDEQGNIIARTGDELKKK